MSSIRFLIMVVGFSLLVAPVALAEADEPQVESPPSAGMATAPAAQADVQPPAEMAGPPAAEPQGTAAASETPAAEAGQVARAVFTTAVADREPSDELSVIPNSTSRVYFFTELRGLEGQRVTHRWQQGGDVRAEVPFDVRGPRWRVWSSKEILPEWTGEWRVTVVGEGGAELATRSFTYQAQESQE